MIITLICRANTVAATNSYIKTSGLDPDGGDNVTVPLIGISDPDTATPTHYGVNWQAGDENLRKKLQTGVVNSPHVSLFVDRDFYEVIAEMGLRVKPSATLL